MMLSTVPHSALLGRVPPTQRFASRTHGRVCAGDRSRALRLRCDAAAAQKRAVIVGGGPAGLLTAHLLLKRGDFQVSLHELRGDPRKENPTSFRQYSLGLGARGRNALQQVDGLWEAVKEAGLESDKFQLHFGEKAINIRAKGSDHPSVLVNRGALCGTMYEQLLKMEGAEENLEVHFNSKCEKVDLDHRRVTFQQEGAAASTAMDYDLLVGTDGVRSAVRGAFEGREGFHSEVQVLPGKFKVLHQVMPPALDEDAVHALTPSGKADKSEGSFGLFIIPAVGGQACMLVNYQDGGDTPPKLLTLTTAEEVQACISERYPSLGAPITLEAAQQFLDQRPSLAGVVSGVERYHDLQGQAVLLGDAAHSTGGSLGQGANSALQDVLALDRALHEHSEDMRAAVLQYSEQQVPEGKALYALLQLNSPGRRRNPLVSVLYLVWSNFLQTPLSQLFPDQVKPNIQTMLTQSLVPYSQVAQDNAFWLDNGKD